jgi:hypothetical protein
MKKLKDNAVEDYDQKRGLERAKIDEIKLVFEDLKAMEPVRKEDTPGGYKGHNTHLFIVEKLAADGSHEKYKSRLVAHGNEQDSTIYADWSSWTVAIQSLMTCLAIAACNRDCMIGKLDIKGAFIQTEMTDIPVYMQCKGKLKDLIVKLLQELFEYMGSDGVLATVIYVKLCTAAYKLPSCAMRN